MEEVLEQIEYSEESPSGLVWKVSNAKRKAGESVGYIKTNKRGIYSRSVWTTMIYRKSYLCHRLVWILHHGEIPEGMEIDHLDGNSLNNRVENLRCVEGFINKRNRSFSQLNTSGATGVITHHNRDGRKYFKAQWTGLDGRRKGKYFAIDIYGEELAFFLAEEYRKHQIDLMNLAGAGYTDRHKIRE